MHRDLLDILIDPVSKEPLRLEEHHCAPNGEIVKGFFHSSEGRSYVITNGIPRFVLTEDSRQKQTANSFAFKWRQRATYNSPHFRKTSLDWKFRRYGFRNAVDMQSYFGNHKHILDAGCGSGYSASLWLDALKGQWIGVEISTVIDVAQEQLRHIAGTHFIQADILQLPFRNQTFDLILAEGVLHHTPSTGKAIKALAPLVQPGGEVIFYVYRKKGPIREFTDDYVREIVSALPAEEAWSVLRPLTLLGQALAELKAEVAITEDIPYLGIKAGRYDVQRLIYWHFAKLFWNEAFSFEENNHVNFDWYHPRYAHRQTEEDIRRWCAEAQLSIVHFCEEESGFSVRCIRD